MPRLCLPLGYQFDLDLSMYPSFVSSLYVRIAAQRWRRVIGASHIVFIESGRVCCEGDGCSIELVEKLSGLWCMERCLRGIAASKYSEPLRQLLMAYRGLSVSAAGPGDELLVASAVVLSRRTSYARNVRRWMYIIFKHTKSLYEAAERAARLPSPQPRLLAAILHELAETLQEGCTSPWRLRQRLLGIPGVGPKTADAILLFTGCSSRVAPGDVHLARFTEMVLGWRLHPPLKNRCLRTASCMECTYAASCLTGRIVREFGDGAGLVQTLAYVHDSLGGRGGWRARLEEVLAKHYTSSGGTSSGR
ncbi:hypothetical protein [Hyperthermus butylicus]|uniref:Helix-hairpin-helix DNA-binding motif class 1 domain-containing protein n=1 Tax=Hyperthermus butylicus (strain DSM 5456 / JCM 9403 / PLM1-5) TaxID=415426 RepID=A2BJ87_HYPBU|nr:hypothetical protein [Hyperthermus butylicus]ABM80048.1 hypothetical protein Hbut_0176 [Hyperthermus butylicus DSM 5456]